MEITEFEMNSLRQIGGGPSTDDDPFMLVSAYSYQTESVKHS